MPALAQGPYPHLRVRDEATLQQVIARLEAQGMPGKWVEDIAPVSTFHTHGTPPVAVPIPDPRRGSNDR
jgi:hypothetical protein